MTGTANLRKTTDNSAGFYLSNEDWETTSGSLQLICEAVGRDKAREIAVIALAFRYLYLKSKSKPVVFQTEMAEIADITKKTVATGSIVPRWPASVIARGSRGAHPSGALGRSLDHRLNVAFLIL